MCGACGSGVAGAPWEARIIGDDASARRALAAALVRCSTSPTGHRVKPNPFGMGYLVESTNGRRTLAATLDDAVAALRLSAIDSRHAGVDAPQEPTDQSELADVLVCLARRRTSAGRHLVRLNWMQSNFVVTAGDGTLTVERALDTASARSSVS